MEDSKARVRNRITGVILVAIGLLLLTGQFVDPGASGLIWPAALLAAGGLFLFGVLTGGPSSAGLAVPGSVLSMMGLLALAQAIFGTWNPWAYSWTLVLMSIGLGIYLMGWRQQDARRRRRGLNLAGISALLFVVLAGLSELGGRPGAAQTVLPLLLVGVGLYLLLKRAGLWPAPRRPPEPGPPPEAPTATDPRRP